MKKYLLLTLVASMCQVDVILGCWADNDNGDGSFWSWNCREGIDRENGYAWRWNGSKIKFKDSCLDRQSCY